MKRIMALALGLLLLVGCGGVGVDGLRKTSEEDIQWVDYWWGNEGADAPRFPLYLELPEDDIQLYGVCGKNYQGGMVLFHEGRETYFSDWGYAHYDYPRMTYYDFDGDGEREIGVITLMGNGTGLLLSDLHIVTMKKEERYEGSAAYDNYAYTYIDHAFTHEDVAAYFNKAIKYKYDKQANTVDITLANQRITASLNPDYLGHTIAVGTCIHFYFTGNRIELRASLETDSYMMGESVGCVTADVAFDGKEIRLNNIKLGTSEEYTEWWLSGENR